MNQEEVSNELIKLKVKMYELMSGLGTGHNEIWYHYFIRSVHWLDTSIKNLPLKERK